MQKSLSSEIPVYLVDGKRTPIGSFNGKLSKHSATDLAGFCIKALLESIHLPPSKVDEVVLGNVVSAGIGQAPAKQAAIKGGLPMSVPCTTINKVCSSGMKSIMYGCQSIRLGESGIVLAGGFENMSNAPYYLQGHRRGHSFGNDRIMDGIALDGLTDPFKGISMGDCAEKTVTDFGFDRESQDSYALTSYKRSIESISSGRFSNQIVPVEGVNADEEHTRFNEAKFRLLKPAFIKNTGTITAGNASKLNDGACAVILASQQQLSQFKLPPLARIVGCADAEVESVDFCIAPHQAILKLLLKTNLTLDDISYFEINEAFAATILANMKLMKLSLEKVNVYGGAISLGHPIGMSGARIVLNLAHILREKNARYGVAAVCNGGGGASAILLQNPKADR